MAGENEEVFDKKAAKKAEKARKKREKKKTKAEREELDLDEESSVGG